MATCQNPPESNIYKPVGKYASLSGALKDYNTVSRPRKVPNEK